jgi:C-terminal processing protease CtpA/Prc
LLRAIDVVEESSDTAVFEFQTENGQTVTAELAAVSMEKYRSQERVNRSEYKTYSLLYTDWVSSNYWYKMLPEEDALYIRIARFAENAEVSLLEMSEQIIDEIGETEGIGKVIVDLRNNTGGMAIEGYKRFFPGAEFAKNRKGVCTDRFGNLLQGHDSRL